MSEGNSSSTGKLGDGAGLLSVNKWQSSWATAEEALVARAGLGSDWVLGM